ncbi:MAG TPA: hypothetical protein VHM92_00455 [Allosphingosinicella sp.]|nr:hypothetical protein [Allosphingosinicella sp.]
MRRIQEAPAMLAALGLSVSVLLFAEWHTDEPPVVLGVLLVVSFLSGLAVPARFLPLGVCLGFAIVVAHAFSTAARLMIPRYQTQAPSVGDRIVMTLLVVPSVVAAYVGSRAGASMRPS